MDPFSLTLSAATVISMTGSVLSTCYTYGCAVAGASEEQNNLLGELTNLCGVLAGLKAMLEAGGMSKPHMSTMSETLEQCLATLKGLEVLLEKSMASNSGAGKALKRMMWPLKSKDIVPILAKLERQKSTFTNIMVQDSHLLSLDIKYSLQSIHARQKEDMAARKSESATKSFAAISRWLGAIDQGEAHKAASSLGFSGTGEWLLSSEELTLWLNADTAFLWLYGIPGSGKTVFTSTILNQSVLPLQRKDEIIAYYYCDFRTKQSQDPKSLIGSLLFQICCQLETFPEIMQSSFDSHNSKSGQVMDLELAESQKLLLAVIPQCPNLTLVVDALDECNSRSDILGFLTSLQRRPGKIKILVTSRREHDIQQAFANLPQVHLDKISVQRDVHLYLSSIVTRDERLRRLNPSLKSLMVETLTNRAQGMFRWVQCQVDSLKKCRTDKATRQALETLPQDLDETYERILSKVSEDDYELVRRSLLWLAHTRKPLTLTELCEAVVVETDIDDLDPESRLRDPYDLLQILGCLVLCHENKKELEVVLAHHSVKEYLMCSRLLSSKLSKFYLGSTGNIEIARTCLTYLLFKHFSTGPCISAAEYSTRLDNYPLFIYASGLWPDHARPVLSTDKKLFQLAMRLFDPSSTKSEPQSSKGYRNKNFMSWIQCICAWPMGDSWSVNHFNERATPLYYASSFGLTEIVEELINRKVALDAPGGRFLGTALHAAVWRGHNDILKMLIDAGADQSRADIQNETPADLAIWANRSLHALKLLGVEIDTSHPGRLMYRVPYPDKRLPIEF